MQGDDGVDFIGQTVDEDVEMERGLVERSKKVGSDDRGKDTEAGNEEDDDDDEEGEEEGPNERKRKRAKVGVNFHLSNVMANAVIL